VLTAGEGTAFDQSGREVTVMLWPDPKSLDPAVAFQTLTVQWSGTQNYVDAPDYMGDAAIRTASEYRVFVPVCSVSNAAPTGDGNWTAKITSNAPAAPTFDYSNQVILGFSPSTISSAFQREHVLAGGADDGLHKDVNALNYGNRSAAEGGSAGIKLDFTAVDANDYGDQQVQRDHIGDLRWAVDSYGRAQQVGDDADLASTDWPFQFSQVFGYSGEGKNVLARAQLLGEDDNYIQSDSSIVRYIGGGSYPEGMTATTKTGGAIDISGVPDLTTDVVLPAIGGFGFLVQVGNCVDPTRDGWYSAEVADADTINVWKLDGSSTGWSGDQAAEVTFYLARRSVLAREDSDATEMLHLLTSPHPSVMCQGNFVVDNPLDVGTNQFLGWGFAYYDLNRERFLFEARASGAAAAMSFASTDEVLADPTSGVTGPDERYSGLKAGGYASNEGDLLLFTGNDSSGAVYLGQPHEGATWSWLTFDDLFMMLTSVDNYSMKNLLPWTANLNLGSVLQPWDVYAHDLRVDGTVTGNLVPFAASNDLGDGAHPWDAFLDNITISGEITGNLVPVSAGSDLGDGAHPWDAYLDNITISGELTGNLTPSINSDGSTGYDIGGTAARWRDLYAFDGRFYDALEADGNCDFGHSSPATTSVLRGNWSLGGNVADDFTILAEDFNPDADDATHLGLYNTESGLLRRYEWIVAVEWWCGEKIHQGTEYDKSAFTTGSALSGGRAEVYIMSAYDANFSSGVWDIVNDALDMPESTSGVAFIPIDFQDDMIAEKITYRYYRDASATLTLDFGYWSGSSSADWAWNSVQVLTTAGSSWTGYSGTTMNKYVRRSLGRWGVRIDGTTGAGETVKLSFLRIDGLIDNCITH